MSEPKVQPAEQAQAQAQAQATSNPGETILYQAPGAEAAPGQGGVPAYKPEQSMMAGQPAQQQAPPQTSEWNAGLCGCCSPFTSCLLACCAPCISMLLLVLITVMAWRNWLWAILELVVMETVGTLDDVGMSADEDSPWKNGRSHAGSLDEDG